jgi:hypothetical protein
MAVWTVWRQSAATGTAIRARGSAQACLWLGISSVFKHRWIRPIARLSALYRLIFLQRHFAFDIELFLFDQAGGFVGLF